MIMKILRLENIPLHNAIKDFDKKVSEYSGIRFRMIKKESEVVF